MFNLENMLVSKLMHSYKFITLLNVDKKFLELPARVSNSDLSLGIPLSCRLKFKVHWMHLNNNSLSQDEKLFY